MTLLDELWMWLVELWTPGVIDRTMPEPEEDWYPQRWGV